MQRINFVAVIFSLFFLVGCQRPLENINHTVNPNLISKSVTNRLSNSGKNVDLQYNTLGLGYDATDEYADQSHSLERVIDVAKLATIRPDKINSIPILSTEGEFIVSENAYEYSKTLGNKVSGNQDSIPLFGDFFKVSFGYDSSNSNKINGKYLYGSYFSKTILKRNNIVNSGIDLKDFVTDAFKIDAENLSPEELVNIYGTHVLTNISVGAKLEVDYRGESSSNNRTEVVNNDLKISIAKIFSISNGSNSSTSTSFSGTNKHLHYKTNGGDPSKTLTGNIDLDLQLPTIAIGAWQNSINNENSVLIDINKGGMIMISELIKNPLKKVQVAAYINNYLNDHIIKLFHNTTPIHRSFYPHGGKHLLTAYPYQDGYYMYEGIAFNAYNYKVPGSKPVYRFHNPITSQNKYSFALVDEPGMINQCIEFYAFDVQNPGTVKLRSFRSNNAGADFLYTINQSEINAITNGYRPFYTEIIVPKPIFVLP